MQLAHVSCKTLGWFASLVTIGAWAFASHAAAGGGEVFLYSTGPWSSPPLGERVLADLGGVDLTVERVGGVDGAASVELFFEDRTATAGQDYVPVPQTLRWADQDGSPRHVKVPILDDTLFEGREAFVAALRNPSGAVLRADALVSVDIADDEEILRFSTDRVAVSESDAAVVAVEREVSDWGVESVAVEVQFQDGTAVAGADFSATPLTLSWGPVEAGRTAITLGLVDDAVPEPPEEFSVTLVGPDHGLGDSSSLTVRVFDDDAVPPGGALVFGANWVAASEQDGEIVVAVHRVDGASGEVAVECFASAGSASPGRDFAFEPQRIEWGDGDKTSRSVRIPWVDDWGHEGVETLVLSFRDLVGATLYSPSHVEVRVDDPEDARVMTPPPVDEAANMFAGGFENIGCFIGCLR
jgi:hypothetical protein